MGSCQKAFAAVLRGVSALAAVQVDLGMAEIMFRKNWTNTLSNLNKYISWFEQIHWAIELLLLYKWISEWQKSCLGKLNKYGFANWKNTSCDLNKFLEQLKQKKIAFWTNTFLDLNKYIEPMSTCSCTSGSRNGRNHV